MDKTDVVNFTINEEDVISHAPIVYRIIQKYYNKINKLVAVLSDDITIKRITQLHSCLFGILPGPNIKYGENILNNDEFKISVIYHLCLSNIIGHKLSWEEYIHISRIFQDMVMKVSTKALSVDSIMVEILGINPTILPKSYITKTMKIDEFNKAVMFIFDKIPPLKYYTDGFTSYDDYFDYMKGEVVKITNECHEREFYNTHEINRFTCVCISFKMRLPSFDVLYNIDDIGRSTEVDMEVENIKEMQEQILTKIFD